MTQHPIVGTWSLDSIQFEDAVSGERFDVYGKNPDGVIIINPDGHAFVLITGSGRKTPDSADGAAELFNNMMAYAGKYRLEGNNRFIVAISTAWHPTWVGTEQVRNFEVIGDTLTITTPELTHPNFPGRTGRGNVEWHRAM